MFQKDKIDELSKFCNIEVKYSVAEKKFNTSPKVTELDIDTKAKIAQRYKSVYNFVAEYYPNARAIWGGYEFL